MELPFPVCHKCRQTVPRMDYGLTPDRQYYHFKVFCHGEEEACTVPIQVFGEALQVFQGWVFKEESKEETEKE